MVYRLIHYSLLYLMVFFLTTSFVVNAQSLNSKPNIVILLADDMGYGDVGVYGAKQIPTPNMDRLAAEGMVFTDAHSPGPTCTPTRYALLTGRYYWRSTMDSRGGLGYTTSRLEPEFQTLPEFLRNNGYHTFMIGKWHLGWEWTLKDGAETVGRDGENIDYREPIANGPIDKGFDYYFGIPASLDMPPYLFVENKLAVDIPTLKKEPKNTLQWDRGGLMIPGWRDEDVGPTFTEKAMEFIRSHHVKRPGTPFFLYFAASAPHTPALPLDFIKGKSTAGARGDMVAEFDWSVGEILRLLNELGLADNTIVIVTSDNGALTDGAPHWGDPLDRKKYDVDHRGHEPNGILRGQKTDVYEGATRVPFIVRWPGVTPERQVNRDLISIVDLYATFGDLLDQSVPSTTFDSYNILPAFYGERLDSERVLVHRSQRGLYGIRKGSWKLIDGRGSGGFTQPTDWVIQQGQPKGQLYNLDTDMTESRNLWSSHPDIVNELKPLLEEYKNKQ